MNFIILILLVSVVIPKKATAAGASSARICMGGFPAGNYQLSGYFILNPLEASIVVPPMIYVGAQCWESNGIMTILPALSDLIWGEGVSPSTVGQTLLEYFNTRNPALLNAGLLGGALQNISPPINLAGQEHNKSSERQVAGAVIPAQGVYADKQFAENNALKAATQEGANNVPPGACDHLYRAGNLGGNITTKTAQESLYNESKINRYDYSYPTSSMALSNAIQMSSFADVSPLSIFGASDLSAGSVITDTHAARNFIKNATNPLPYAPVAIRNGPAMTDRLAVRYMNTGATVLAQNSLVDLLAERAPVGSDTILQPGIFAASGVQPVQTPIGTGNTSAVSLMRIIGLEVDDRVGNYNYITGLITGNTLSVIKNIITTDGIIDEIKYLQLVTRQRNAALAAAILAREAYIPVNQFK